MMITAECVQSSKKFIPMKLIVHSTLTRSLSNDIINSSKAAKGFTQFINLIQEWLPRQIYSFVCIQITPSCLIQGKIFFEFLSLRMR